MASFFHSFDMYLLTLYIRNSLPFSFFIHLFMSVQHVDFYFVQ